MLFLVLLLKQRKQYDVGSDNVKAQGNYFQVKQCAELMGPEDCEQHRKDDQQRQVDCHPIRVWQAAA